MNIVLILYISLILVLHIIPLGEGGTNRFDLGPLRADYLLHTAIFIPWMFLFCIKPGSGWMPGIRTVKPLPFLGWMALGILLAIGAEGIQYWVDYRAFNPMDGLFNALGVVIGAVFVVLCSTTRSAWQAFKVKKI